MSPPRHLHPVASGSSLSCCPDSDSPVPGASKKPEAMTASCSPRVLWKHYQFSVRWHKQALEALQSSLRNRYTMVSPLGSKLPKFPTAYRTEQDKTKRLPPFSPPCGLAPWKQQSFSPSALGHRPPSRHSALLFILEASSQSITSPTLTLLQST